MKKNFILLLVAVIVLANLDTAKAFHVDCGNTIANLTTTLDSDLVCATYGLFIGASDITLDCNGHSIQGGRVTGAHGISISGKYNVLVNNVTVMNCNISNFDRGIMISPYYDGRNTYYSTKNTLINNTANSNSYDGIAIYSSSDNTIVGNTASSSFFGFGIALYSSSDNTIVGNTANFNKEGIALFDSSGNTIVGNTANSNFAGIDLSVYSSNNILINNTASSNSWQGFYIFSTFNKTFNNILISNTANSNGLTGIDIYSAFNNTILIGNTISSNPVGISFYSSNLNLVYNNFFNNTVNAKDSGINFWNTTKNCSQPNIVGGRCIGGNFWSDYKGKDTNRDGIGDTMLPHNSGTHIVIGGDFLPLVKPLSRKTPCRVPLVC